MPGRQRSPRRNCRRWSYSSSSLQFLDRGGERQRAFGLLDMQVLDHATVDRDHALAFSLRRLECHHDLARHLELGRPWREHLIAGLDLAGMDQSLAVEAHFEPLLADRPETLGVLDVVVDAIENRE